MTTPSKRLLDLLEEALLHDEEDAKKGIDPINAEAYEEAKEFLAELRRKAQDSFDYEFDTAEFYSAFPLTQGFTCRSVRTAMLQYINDVEPFQIHPVTGAITCSVPTVTVYAYKRRKLTEKAIRDGANAALGALLETWDEEYRTEDGSANFTDELTALARVFADRAADKYAVHSFEEVGRKELDLLAWTMRRAPNRLPRLE